MMHALRVLFPFPIRTFPVLRAKTEFKIQKIISYGNGIYIKSFHKVGYR